MKAEASFEKVLPIVNRAVDGVLRRRRKDRDFADDFRGWVMVKMLERDGAKLRRFRGESSLLTYLGVVVGRLYCDYMSSLNGKWRSSKTALRLGAESVHLEKLVYRDGYTLDQAVTVLQTREGKPLGDELREGFCKIPSRRNSFSVSCDSLLESHADTRPSAYDVLREKEMNQASRRVREALTDALTELTDEDRLILEHHFCRGFRISELSRRLGLKQRSVYKRFYRILRSLRQKLEAKAVYGNVVREMTDGGFAPRGIEGAFAAAAARCASNTKEAGLLFEIDRGPLPGETEEIFEAAG